MLRNHWRNVKRYRKNQVDDNVEEQEQLEMRREPWE